MRQDEILKKAMQKAAKGGWKIGPAWLKEFEEFNSINHIPEQELYIVLFNHDFAKAFFGEEKMCKPHLKDFGNHEGNCQDIEWEYHLQQMVLEEKPLKYLEKFIK